MGAIVSQEMRVTPGIPTVPDGRSATQRWSGPAIMD